MIFRLFGYRLPAYFKIWICGLIDLLLLYYFDGDNPCLGVIHCQQGFAIMIVVVRVAKFFYFTGRANDRLAIYRNG
jgi:hypothetical protein